MIVYPRVEFHLRKSSTENPITIISRDDFFSTALRVVTYHTIKQNGNSIMHNRLKSTKGPQKY